MSKIKRKTPAKYKKFKVHCPYCNEVWDAKMMDQLEAEGTYDTNGTDGGAEITGTIRIFCGNKDCRRLIYKKEYNKTKY